MEHVLLARELAHTTGTRLIALGAIDLGLAFLHVPLDYHYGSAFFVPAFFIGYKLRQGGIPFMLTTRTACGGALGFFAGALPFVLLYRPLRLLFFSHIDSMSLQTLSVFLLYSTLVLDFFLKSSSPRLGFIADPTGTPLQEFYHKPLHSLGLGLLFFLVVLSAYAPRNSTSTRTRSVAASGKSFDPNTIFVSRIKTACTSDHCTTSVTFYTAETNTVEKVETSWTD